MFISYEELKAMEEQYAEQLRVAQSHLEVIRELIKVAEEKHVVVEEQTEEVGFQEEIETQTYAQ